MPETGRQFAGPAGAARGLGIIFGMAEPSDDAELLHRYLRARDEPCPLCGYNLRGLQGLTCPECGKVLRLHVGLVHPNLRAFIAGLVPLAGTFGFAFLTFVWVMYMTWRFGQGLNIRTCLILLGPVVVSGGFMVVWIGLARRIRTTTRAKRTLLLLIAWLIPSLMITLFLILLS